MTIVFDNNVNEQKGIRRVINRNMDKSSAPYQAAVSKVNGTYLHVIKGWHYSSTCPTSWFTVRFYSVRLQLLSWAGRDSSSCRQYTKERETARNGTCFLGWEHRTSGMDVRSRHLCLVHVICDRNAVQSITRDMCLIRLH